MGKIIYINLEDNKITYENNDSKDYGRSLIINLIEKNISSGIDRFDDANAIVLAPGLFSGTLVPSTGRLLVATKQSKDMGIQLSGTISQKLASLNIDAIYIYGKNTSDSPLVITIDENNVSLDYFSDMKSLSISSTVAKLYNIKGNDSGIIGIGPAGENILPISTLFSTYPIGKPSFYCSRNSIGDVFGSKNLKAIVVKNKDYFNSSTYDYDAMKEASKKLSKIILDHPITGNALPNLGSITIMKFLTSGTDIDLDAINQKKSISSDTSNINRTCSPLCVVGCLNRHVKNGNEYYDSPAETEASTALYDLFNINDPDYVKIYTRKCFDLGIDYIEFLFSCNLYFKLENIEGSKESIDNALSALEDMSLIGRVLASKTNGIYNLFIEKTNYKDLVSKPSIFEEHKYNVSIPSKNHDFESLSDLDYLYAFIITLENLGFCLFAAFALIESPQSLDLLSKLYYYKTGIEISPKELLGYSLESIEKEQNFSKSIKLNNTSKSIPNFVKVLYRYFNK